MSMSRTGTLTRGIAVLAALGVGCTWLVETLAPLVRHRDAGGGWTGLLVDLSALVVLLGTAWLGVLTVAAILDGLAARGPVLLPWLGCPAALRSALVVVVGGGLTLVPLSPAVADQVDPPPPGIPQAPTTAGALDGLSLPDRTSDAAGTATPRWLVVRRGDCLWSIARHDLGPGADDDAVATRWRRIYHANRGVIGPDTDLLLPGLRLALPPSLDTTHPSRDPDRPHREEDR